MSLAPGQKLAHYEILDFVGAGGMGEVYRARDTKLDRDVAVKVLPDAVAEDGERLRRFEREAKVLASLNHPNIASIHGLEESEGTHYLVLEMVEGETLAERLRRGPLPLDEAVPLLVQITEGLEAAHDRGIIHRDLKPGNVMLTPDGRVKLLDFGLAKALTPEETVSREHQETDAPTQGRDTQSGTVLGTAAYMSPDQARGKSVDKRADIWAFGCVVFETLSGKRAFPGQTASDTLAAILKEEPDWSTLPPEVPASARKLLKRCLKKSREERLRDIVDARFELQESLETSEVSGRANGGETRRGGRLAWLVSAGLFALVVGSFVVGRGGGNVAPRKRVFSIDAPLGTTVRSAVLSPDGRRVVMVAARAGGSTSLWVRTLDSNEPSELPGTEEAAYPFWSPNSAYVGFFAGGRLKKTSLAGGVVEDLANVISPRGGTWARDDILFVTDGNADVSRVKDTGGAVESVTTRANGENSHRYPYFVAGGRRFLYFARNPVNPEQSGVWLGSLEGEPPVLLVAAPSRAVYAEPGYILFRRGETLIAQKFDAESASLVGDPVAIADHVWFDPSFSGYSEFSASEDGALAYRGGGIEKTELVWLDRAGNRLGSAGEPGNYLNLFLSPDGRFVAVCRTNERTESRDLWIIELNGNVARQVTFNSSSDFEPVWAGDGTIVFSSDRNGDFDIYERSVRGGGDAEPLLANGRQKWVRHASADGALVVFDESDPVSGDVNIGILERRTKDVSYFRETDDHDWFGRFSPDGRWLAYTSNELGTYNVFVEAFPRTGARFRVSSAEGFQPVWNGRGDELFYLARGGTLMAVTMTPAPDRTTVEAGPARALFDTGVSVGSVIQPDSLNHYDVSANGERFLVNRRVDAPSPLLIVLDWQAGLSSGSIDGGR